MRLTSNSHIVLLLAIAAVSALPAASLAQATPAQQDAPRPELALGYAYVPVSYTHLDVYKRQG